MDRLVFYIWMRVLYELTYLLYNVNRRTSSYDGEVARPTETKFGDLCNQNASSRARQLVAWFTHTVHKRTTT